MKDVVEWSGKRWDDILSFLASSLGNHPSLESVVERPNKRAKVSLPRARSLVSFTIDPKIRYALESLGYLKRMRRLQILVMSLF